MRAAIQWSEELLSAEEQDLFARRGIFAGGFDVDAAERVAHATLSALEGLLAANVVRRRGQRFLVLETIREYARGRLGASSTSSESAALHAHHYLTLAQEVSTRFEGEGVAESLARLRDDNENLRQALEWMVGGNDAEGGLRLCIALAPMWVEACHVEEGLERFEQALADSSASLVGLRLRLRAAREAGPATWRAPPPSTSSACATRSTGARGASVARGRTR